MILPTPCFGYYDDQAVVLEGSAKNIIVFLKDIFKLSEALDNR